MAIDTLAPGYGPFMDFDMVFAEAAQQIGGFDNKYRLVTRFLDVAAGSDGGDHTALDESPRGD
jgi:hypothetical protein